MEKVRIKNVSNGPVMCDGKRLGAGKEKSVMLTTGIEYRISQGFFALVNEPVIKEVTTKKVEKKEIKPENGFEEIE